MLRIRAERKRVYKQQKCNNCHTCNFSHNEKPFYTHRLFPPLSHSSRLVSTHSHYTARSFDMNRHFTTHANSSINTPRHAAKQSNPFTLRPLGRPAVRPSKRHSLKATRKKKEKKRASEQEAVQQEPPPLVCDSDTTHNKCCCSCHCHCHRRSPTLVRLLACLHSQQHQLRRLTHTRTRARTHRTTLLS